MKAQSFCTVSLCTNFKPVLYCCQIEVVVSLGYMSVYKNLQLRATGLLMSVVTRREPGNQIFLTL